MKVPDLSLLRIWLDQLDVSYFECDSCQALHLTQALSVNTKIDMIEDVIVFFTEAELKQTAIAPLLVDLSQINASSLSNKVYIDIQDNQPAKLVISQTLLAGVGITIEQFDYFLHDAIIQATLLLDEVRESELLQNTELSEETIIDHYLH